MTRVLLISLLLLAFHASAQDDLVQTPEFLPCAERQLSCGTRVDSELDGVLCLTACGEAAEVWNVRVFVQTTLLTVTATSDDFDPRLELADDTGKLIASNDSVGGRTTAQLQQVLEPGTYLARVVGQPAGAKGNYSISLHCLLSDRQNFCVPDDETLCIAGRFSFRVRASDPRTGATIVATPRPQSEIYGFFSFPSSTGNPDNPEIFVKLIDGRDANDRWWVFWGGLTDLDYEITVRDSFTKRERTYSGQGSDTVSFADP